MRSFPGNPSLRSISLSIADCPVDSATVYVDRAEVNRSVAFEVDEGGEYSVVISGLSECADTDSIRVKALESSAECTIQEVSFDVTRVPVDETEPVAALEDANTRMQALTCELDRLKQRDTLVQQYMKAMLDVNQVNHGSAAVVGATTPAAGADLATVTKLLEFHSNQGSANDLQAAELAKKIKVAAEEVRAAQAELKKLRQGRGGVNSSTTASRNVTVALAITGGSDDGKLPMCLVLTYLVSNSSWQPTYDVRVDTTSAAPTMSLTYFGSIMNSTGEDWENAALSLSTAKPAQGGSPPLPPTKIVQWKASAVFQKKVRMRNMPMQLQQMQPQMQMQMQSQMPMQSMMPERRHSEQMDFSESDDEDFNPPPTAEDENEGGDDAAEFASATFSIERRSTIKADGQEHKVTIAIIDLTPDFRHFATPSLEELVYLQARVTNKSSYELLESARMAVFFDGSFVTRGRIKHTSPGESFSIFLGVDPSVKMVHKMVKHSINTAAKAEGVGAYFKGKKDSSVDREFVTLLNNTKNKPVELTLVDLLPRANDEKITVALVEPPRSKLSGGGTGASSSGAGQLARGGVSQNKITNNIVHSITLQPQQKTEVQFSYRITWQDSEKDVEVV